MQPNEQRSGHVRNACPPPVSGEVREFAEPVPEYLRAGYVALMAGDGETALRLWEALYEKYPSAEVCGHLARVHYYQTYFLGSDVADPAQSEHVEQMQMWAERALDLNPNSSIGHAMYAAALGRKAQSSRSQRQTIYFAWQVRQHAEQAVLIDNTWMGHFVLGGWHREIASVNAALRALAGLLRIRLPEGKYSDSIRHYQEVLNQYPENNTIYAEMAYTYEKMGEWKLARTMYEQALSMPLFRHPIARQLTRIAAERYRQKFGA